MLTALKRRISRLPNYIRAHGLSAGVRLAWSIEKQLPATAEQPRPFAVHPYGQVWLRECVSDHSIFFQCLVRRQYDFSHMAHWPRVRQHYDALVAAGKRPLIIDCGGNVGLSSLWFAHAFPEARIVVVEPDQRNFAVLTRNLSRVAERVQAVNGGVWGHSGTLHITNPEAGFAAFMLAESAAGELPANAIKAYSIDDLMRAAQADEIFIVKVDIEGAQEQVFAENTGWVAKTRVLMIELDDWRLPWQGNSLSFFRCTSQLPCDYVLDGETLFCFRHGPAQ
jgi:FkbM family methyltransferase